MPLTRLHGDIALGAFGEALRPDASVGIWTGEEDRSRLPLVWVLDLAEMARYPTLEALEASTRNVPQRDAPAWMLGEISFAWVTQRECRQIDNGKWQDARIISVSTSAARAGWGPTLYDAALWAAHDQEYDGVAPSDVPSFHARRVWEYYRTRRPDVKSKRMPCLRGDRRAPDDVLDRFYWMPKEAPWIYAALARTDSALVRFGFDGEDEDSKDPIVRVLDLGATRLFLASYNGGKPLPRLR